LIRLFFSIFDLSVFGSWIINPKTTLPKRDQTPPLDGGAAFSGLAMSALRRQLVVNIGGGGKDRDVENETPHSDE